MTSPLGRRDPTVKLAAALALTLSLLLVIDPVTPLLHLTLACTAGIVLGGVPPSALARALAPLVLVGLGFVWTNALFARPGVDGLAFGIAIALRGLAIGALSVVFVLTTDPSRLVASLVAHARVPWRIAYPFLAAYRFLPFFAQEYEQAALALRVRGIEPGASLLARARRAVVSLPLLFAIAIRRASQIAIAMDARGFGAARRRTSLRESPLTAGDAIFAFLALAAGAAILGAGMVGGWLRIWDGRFAA